MTNDPKSDIIAEAIMVGQQTSGRTPWTMAEVVLAALKEKYEITPYRDGEPTFDKDKNFTGWTKRRCGEHRTVGEHRAMCSTCGEWCYPERDMACDGCRIE
jgi:hypothetical protein